MCCAPLMQEGFFHGVDHDVFAELMGRGMEEAAMLTRIWIRTPRAADVVMSVSDGLSFRRRCKLRDHVAMSMHRRRNLASGQKLRLIAIYLLKGARSFLDAVTCVRWIQSLVDLRRRFVISAKDPAVYDTRTALCHGNLLRSTLYLAKFRSVPCRGQSTVWARGSPFGVRAFCSPRPTRTHGKIRVRQLFWRAGK